MGWTLYIYGKKTVFEGSELYYTEHVETTNDLVRMDSQTPCETTPECHRMRLMWAD